MAGELERYNDCYRETEVAPSTKQIEAQEKELLSAGRWKEYRRIENHTKVSLSPKEMKPFEESLREKQKGLLRRKDVGGYFEITEEARIPLPEPEMKKSLRTYLVDGKWNRYLELSERANVKLSPNQLNGLKAKGKVIEYQLGDFEKGFKSTIGDFNYFLASVECLGSMPELSKIQAVQCQYLFGLVSQDKKRNYRTSLSDKAYKASVEATGISVSLEQLELVGKLMGYHSK